MIHGVAPQGIIYLIYYRKSNRHKWLLCGQARADDQQYYEQLLTCLRFPGWQLGRVTMEHAGGSYELEGSLTQSAEVELL